MSSPRASSRNHNHTRTAMQGRNPANSRLNTHNSHSTPNNNIAHRLDMQTPPTPPAEDRIRRGATANGGVEPPTTPSANQAVAKFASPSAPSFASVVSSSSAARGSAKSPLSPKSDPSSAQSRPQKQEQAHQQVQPPATDSQTSLQTQPIRDGGTHAKGEISPRAPAIADVAAEAHISRTRSLSPATHENGRIETNAGSADAGEDQNQENELEDSESSDVEIYLNTLGLHDSAARMHVFGGPGDGHAAPMRKTSVTLTQPSNESPIIPSSMQFGNESVPNAQAGANSLRLGAADLTSTKSLSPLSFTLRTSDAAPPSPSHLRTLQTHQFGATTPIGAAKSPQLPAAPVHGTIPLPHVDDKDYIQEADARQLHQLQQHQQQQQQQQQTHSQPTSIGHNNDTIDLTGLTIGTGGGDAFRGQQLGLAASHSQPMLTIDPPYNTNQDPYQNMGLGPISSLPTSASDSNLSGAGQKTPNVYINGLPPHFREDQLFDLTSPFGAIRSVRTFTRHVRDSESGYGFVLFETIEAAERCIISLRRYRNLHPTFSKQIHKIPGTTYAQGAVAPPSTATMWNEALDSDTASNIGSNADSLGHEASFKAKMESLQDPTSTNLYMEGLPLSLDEATLAALVAPHVISSSRFFHTRLSNPPRIIAFVRLETRKGAEEIIERLHGRMVRGWNDTGSRISVRFADTSEQRELRRMERSAQEGDASPSRLTIAQAALLNLRGKDLGPATPAASAHGYGADTGRIVSSTSSRGFGNSYSPDFASNAHLAPELEVDYTLAPVRAISNSGSRARSPYQTHQTLGYQQTDLYAPGQSQLGYGLGHSPTSAMDPAMAALINSLGNTNLAYQGGHGGYGDGNAEMEYMQRGGVQQGMGHHMLTTSQSVDNLHHYSRPGPAYTRSGYTPAEEYIMRAHAESAALAAQQQQAERRRPAPLDLRRRRGEEGDYVTGANIAVGVRGYRAQASVGRMGNGLISPSTPMGALPSPTPLSGMGMGNMTSDDFHSTMRNDFGRSPNYNAGNGELDRTVGSSMYARHNPNIHPPHVNARLGREQPPASAPSTMTSYPAMRAQIPAPAPEEVPAASPVQQQESPNPGQAINYQHAAAHLRSTTLPQHRSSSAREGQHVAGRGHYQHSSMSMPAQNLRTPQHASVAQFGGAGSGDSAGAVANGTIYEDGNSREDAQHRQHQLPNQGQQQQPQQHQPQTQQQQQQQRSSPPASAVKYSPRAQHIFGDMETSSSTSSLISPTLTYGAQTPSTLSPATPFFGSFSSQAEAFEKAAQDSALDGHQKKQGSGHSAVGSALRS